MLVEAFFEVSSFEATPFIGRNGGLASESIRDLLDAVEDYQLLPTNCTRAVGH